MEAPAKGGMALYYKKLLELQEKLKERERMHCKKLQFQCRKLIDKDRKRQERNDEIIRSLEDIEMRMRRLASKTKDLELFRYSKENYSQKNRHFQSGIEESAEMPFTLNHNREEYYEKTLNRNKSSDFNNRDKKLNEPIFHRFNKTPDDLNSLAEHMTNSISSRYYKKDIIETTPNLSYHTVSPPKKEFEKGVYDEIRNEKMSYDTKDLKVHEPKMFEAIGEYKLNESSYSFDHLQNLVSENKDETDNQPSIIDSQKDDQLQETPVNRDGEDDMDQEPSQIEREKKNVTKLESSMNISHESGLNNLDSVEKDLICENKSINQDICPSGEHDLIEKKSENVASLNRNEYQNSKVEKNLDKSYQLTEEHVGYQHVDENNEVHDKKETGPLNNYNDYQITQPDYDDDLNESNQYFTDRKPKQFSTTKLDEFSEQNNNRNNENTGSKLQPDVNRQSVIYSDNTYDEYDQPINHIEQTLHCSETEHLQNSNIDNNRTENRKIPTHPNKTEELDLATETLDKEQEENSKQHQDTEISKTNKEECETQNVSPNQVTFDEIHSEQVPHEIQQSMRTFEFEHEIDSSDQQQDQHLDEQYDHHTQQFEHGSHLQYDENGQPILHYEENSHLQEYDPNAEYHYDQQYNNTGQHYEENSETYHQQYGQFDESQMYHQTGEIHNLEEGHQLYVNQDGQYVENNPQNYQYNEVMNIGENDTGIYPNQDGIYPDNLQASGSEGINATEVHPDAYMGQMEQYDQIGNISPHTYQQHQQVNDTMNDGDVEQVLKSEVTTANDYEVIQNEVPSTRENKESIENPSQ
nr:putative leucine-rich repeat-containing protein DDB_G0290503 [Leptinotarsa decemlineata]